MPVAVHADQVVEAVINLLENAIKYTPSGGRVQLVIRPIDNRLQIRVEDTGPGIPAEDLPHIFDRFYRVDKARSRQRGSQNDLGSGAGLGLSITKALVEQNGGVIAAYPAATGGMVFAISFPLR